MLWRFKTLIENHTGQKIKKLWTDNCLKFYDLDFNEFCAIQGMPNIRPWSESLNKMGRKTYESDSTWQSLLYTLQC